MPHDLSPDLCNLNPPSERHYNSALSIWLSVDPMSDKYPNESPYIYCGNNPVILMDPNGREKIDAYGRRNRDNTHNKDACARYKDNSPVIHLWAHGNSSMINTYNPENNNRQSVKTADDMHAFLCEHSSIYQKNSEENKSSILVLHSCEAGKGENNIAQQISSELDLLVVAPNEKVYNSIENMGTQQEFTSEIGVNRTYEKDGQEIVGQRGSWIIYYKGIKVDSFDGHTKPNFKNPQKIIEKYEKEYQKIISKEE